MSNNFDAKAKRFTSFGKLTVVLIYIVIIAGGIVRATGSGMGCPDWPKCFGQWIPPTNISELPSNYQDIYSHRGYADVEFNALKTWIEYINRLIGVLVGFSIFLFLIYSISFFTVDKLIFFMSLIAFILVGFQGWLGSVVVATVLSEWMITIHMLVALIIVLLVIFILGYAEVKLNTLGRDIYNVQKVAPTGITVSLIILLLMQIIMGTQVRENVDAIAKIETNKQLWPDLLNFWFYIHRSTSILFIILVFWWYQKVKLNAQFKFWVNLFVFITLSEIALGASMYYFHFPIITQPLHLLFGCVMIGILGYIFTVSTVPKFVRLSTKFSVSLQQ